MIGTLGGPEIFLILILALIFFGPRKLPEIGKSIGSMLVEFRRASNDFKRTVEQEVEAEKKAITPPAAPIQSPVAASASVAQTAPRALDAAVRSAGSATGASLEQGAEEARSVSETEVPPAPAATAGEPSA
jgi:TatA/E family protein of Tat protein translocase